MMFDLPDAKRIKRSEIYKRSGSVPTSDQEQEEEQDPAIQSILYSQLAALYGPIESSTTQPNQVHDAGAPPPPEDGEDGGQLQQEFEFRLFSTPSKANTAADDTIKAPSKIILQDEFIADAEGGFITPKRPASYYIVGKASGERRQRIDLTAVEGSTVIEWSRRRAWGLEVPWRVKVLKTARRAPHANEDEVGLDRVSKVTSTSFDVAYSAHNTSDLKTKKTKPNKKRRILLRQRRRKKETMEEQRQRAKELKEEAEREKRTRRNREKKVKRKLKEKAKKVDGRSVATSAGMDAESASD